MSTGPTSQDSREAYRARGVAQSFGSDADLYDRTRPRYPDVLVGRILSASHGSDVLDVGCGTGIAARAFQTQGCVVLGIDPDQRMAEFARRRGLDVEVATFESWNSAGRQFDVLVAGQAWHWVDPVVGAAKAAKVLRPRGRLAVFWYVFEPPTGVAEAFSDVYQRVLPGTPFSRGTSPGMGAYSIFFDKTTDGLTRTGAFGDTEQWRFDWDHSYSRHEWLEQVPTFGGHSQFSPTQLQDILSGIGAAIESVGGNVTMHYTAVVVTAERIA
jgi:SAM-dependent methyltransferase